MRHVIADDLSGALEIAGAARASGFRAIVILDIEGCAIPQADVLVWCSGARVLSGDDLRRRMGQVLGRIDFEAANGLYLKIDSTLRGPLAEMFTQVLHWSRQGRLLLTPANPGTGRTVRGGCAFVDGVALSDSAFGDDPVFPMGDSAVSEVLKPLRVEIVGQEVLQLKREGVFVERALEEPVIFAPDAESDDELDVVASSASGFRLLAGSAGFFQALLRGGWAGSPRQDAGDCNLTQGGDRWLVINGSRHGASYEQVARLADQKRVKVVQVSPSIAGLDETSLIDELESLSGRLIEAVRARGGACLQLAKSCERVEAEAALRLPEFVGRLAKRLDAAMGLGALICSGGDTAGAVCEALGVYEMEAVEELGPGCVWGVMRSDARVWDVFIKPGGYSGEDLLLKAVNWLESCDN